MQPQNRTYTRREIGTVRHFKNEAERRKGKAPSVSVPVFYHDFVDRNRYLPAQCRKQGKR